VAPNPQNSDVESIAAQLRASIRKARVPRSRIVRTRVESAAVGELEGAIEHDLVLMRSNYDIARAPFASHRPVLGRFIILIKNVARELLVQLLDRQSSYNGAAVRAISNLGRKLDLIAQEQERLLQRLTVLEARVAPGPPPAVPRISRAASAAKHLDGFDSGGLNERMDAIEEAIGGPRRGLSDRT